MGGLCRAFERLSFFFLLGRGLGSGITGRPLRGFYLLEGFSCFFGGTADLNQRIMGFSHRVFLRRNAADQLDRLLGQLLIGFLDKRKLLFRAFWHRANER